VVRADLQLEPVLRTPLGSGHDTRVVDEDVKVALPGLGERADRAEVGEVELADLPLAGDGRGRMPALGRVAHGEDDARASASEFASGDEADAAVGARHEEGAAIEAGSSAEVHFRELMPVNVVGSSLGGPVSLSGTSSRLSREDGDGLTFATRDGGLWSVADRVAYLRSGAAGAIEPGG
jgi:hypothetical protein